MPTGILEKVGRKGWGCMHVSHYALGKIWAVVNISTGDALGSTTILQKSELSFNLQCRGAFHTGINDIWYVLSSMDSFV